MDKESEMVLDGFKQRLISKGMPVDSVSIINSPEWMNKKRLVVGTITMAGKKPTVIVSDPFDVPYELFDVLRARFKYKYILCGLPISVVEWERSVTNDVVSKYQALQNNEHPESPASGQLQAL